MKIVCLSYPLRYLIQKQTRFFFAVAVQGHAGSSSKKLDKEAGGAGTPSFPPGSSPLDVIPQGSDARGRERQNRRRDRRVRVVFRAPVAVITRPNCSVEPQ